MYSTFLLDICICVKSDVWTIFVLSKNQFGLKTQHWESRKLVCLRMGEVDLSLFILYIWCATKWHVEKQLMEDLSLQGRQWNTLNSWVRWKRRYGQNNWKDLQSTFILKATWPPLKVTPVSNDHIAQLISCRYPY